MIAQSRDLPAPQAVSHQARRAALVLAATDGAEQSDVALRVALDRAAMLGAQVEVVSVIPGKPMVSDDGVTLGTSAVTPSQRSAQRELVEEQLARVTGEHRRQVITIRDGHPAAAIARLAVERRAALIVAGMGRHRLSDRLFSDETALQLIRLARMPVLAVPRDATAAVRSVLVAVDFSALSARAAQCALDTVADGGQVHLVHALPAVLEEPFTVEPEEPHARWALARLATLASQLAVPLGVTVHAALVRGRPAPSLLEQASRVHADLIVTGTHGKGLVARALLGSVASKLLRASPCPLLTVPRNPLPALEPSERPADAVGERMRWIALMDELTRRNRGRRTMMESEDLEQGTESQELNYAFVGGAYDDRNDQLRLMFSDGRGSSGRLARHVGEVRALDVLTDAAGQDAALRVEHGSGQTLVTFME